MKKTTILFSLLFLLFSMKAFSEENTGCFQVIIGPEACQSDFSYWISEIGEWSTYFPSGHVICNISPGHVEVRFRPVSYWDIPENMNIIVEANQTSVINAICLQKDRGGCILVSIEPEECQSGYSFWISEMGEWSAYFTSNHVICNIPAGQVGVRFRPVSGWVIPQQKIINVEANKTSFLEVYCCPQKPVQPIITSIGQGVSTEGVSIQWMEDRCDVQYQIYRNVTNNWSTSELIADQLEGNAYTDTSVTSDSKYYYWIRAMNQYSYSEESHYEVGYLKLSSPQNVLATDRVHEGFIRVTFDAVNGANGYEIWRGTDTFQAYAQYVRTVYDLYFDDTYPIYEKLYVYWIKATNRLTTSDYSQFYAWGRRKIPDVEYVQVSNRDFDTNEQLYSTIMIKFTPIGDEAYHGIVYSLIRDEGRLKGNTSFGQSISNEGYFEDQSVYAGKTYYYAIKAQNAYGSSISNYNVGRAEMSRVTGLTASQSEHLCQVFLEWEYVNDASSYYIYRNTLDDFSSASKIGESITNSFWDNAGRAYFYWVKAANEYTVSMEFEDYVLGYPSICRYHTSVSEIIFDHNGGTFSFTVIPNFNTPGCSWRISSSADWINSISPAFGSGEQTVTFNIDPNKTPLAGTIDIKGDDAYSCNYDHSSIQVVSKQYIIDLEIIGNGQILLNDMLKTLPWKGNFAENETVKLEAIPSDDFFQWTGDLTNNNSSVSIVMNGNKKIIAVFNRFDFVLKKGWNLISLPTLPVDNKLSSIFPDAEVAFSYKQGSYLIADRLIPGKGYWVKIPSDAVYPIGGPSVPFYPSDYEYDIHWNLIGATDQISPSETFSLTGVSAIYEYSNGVYHIPNQFEPGKGYWIKKQ